MKAKTSSNEMSTWPLQYGNSPPCTELATAWHILEHINDMYVWDEMNPRVRQFLSTRMQQNWTRRRIPQRFFFKFNCGIPMWSCYQCELKTLGNNMVIFISWDTFTFLVSFKKAFKTLSFFQKMPCNFSLYIQSLSLSMS